MRILHLGKYYPPERGGMETVLQHISEGLLARDHEIRVIVAGRSWLDRHEALAAVGVDDHAVTDGDGTDAARGRLTRAASLGVFNSQPLTPGLPRLLRRELSEFRPDLVHVHLPNPAACFSWLALALWHAMPPLAIWHHADITRQRLGKVLVAPLVRSCLAQARGICVSSTSLADGSADLLACRDKVTTIPFGIEVNPWSEVDSSFDGPFLFVGRLVPYKGLELLVDAFVELDDTPLVVIGEGPLRAKLAARVRRAGVADRIQLVGEVSSARMVELMGSAQALVLPSLDRSETFGVVQLEAMAAGLPVITSRLPTGVAEVCRDGETGVLAEPGSRPDLQAAVRLLRDDRDLARALGAAGRRRVIEHFTAERMIDRLVDWYATLLA